MTSQHRPVGDNEEETRTNQRCKEHEDAEIPNFVGINLELARGVKREHECKQHSQCGSCTVGRDDERADVEENRMHLSKHRALGRQGNSYDRGLRYLKQVQVDCSRLA